MFLGAIAKLRRTIF